jgi:Amt family ammonium transporter
MIRWLKSFVAFQLLCSGLLFAQDAATEAVATPQAPVAESPGPLTAVAETVPAPTPAPSMPVKGDEAWMLTSTALVLFMTPGLAFFYGGLVGRKNVLSILMQCFMCMSVVTVLWVLVGYSIAFSDTEIGGGFCGNPMKHFLLNGVATDAPFEPVKGVPLGLSQQTFMVFQMMVFI